MEFTAPAEHYDRFMGRYVPKLAVALADAAGVEAGMRALDVGCGPGGLTRELAARLGHENVAAIDPAEQFADACRARNPGSDVRVGGAEELPWGDREFDAALASLVVAFMRDARQGAREMARVTKPGGAVAACMWDVPGGGMTMLSSFWRAARSVDPATEGEQTRVGVSHEADHQRRQRDVERRVVEREVLGAADAHVGAGVARAARLGELLRGVDRRHVVGAEPRGELARQPAGSAADVERAHPRLDAGGVGERDGEPRDVAPHEAVVVLGGRGELHPPRKSP